MNISLSEQKHHLELIRNGQNGIYPEAIGNRYSYVLNNPLKYTDPSGWVAYQASSGLDAVGGGVNTFYGPPVLYIDGVRYDGDAAANLLGLYTGGGGGGSVVETYGSTNTFQDPGLDAFHRSRQIQSGNAYLTQKNNEKAREDRKSKFGNGTKGLKQGDDLLAYNGSESLGIRNYKLPDEHTGGFFENWSMFYNWMVEQANINPKEVSAFELRKDGVSRYWVLPWFENTYDESFNDVNNLPTGYERFHIINQFHTHHRSLPGSVKDLNLNKYLKIPINTIGADGSIFRVNYYPNGTEPLRLEGLRYYGYLIRNRENVFNRN